MLQNLWQNMSLHLIDPTAITCCVNFGARCYKIYGKCKNFLMAVYMIFKYSKRFRYAPSFNKMLSKKTYNWNCITWFSPNWKKTVNRKKIITGKTQCGTHIPHSYFHATMISRDIHETKIWNQPVKSQVQPILRKRLQKCISLHCAM